MEINQDIINHILSSSGGAGAVAGGLFMFIRRILARVDKLESKIDQLEIQIAKSEMKLELITKG